MAFDLRAYCRRINYDGDAQPTETTLRRLHWQHVTTFPFENVSVAAGLPIRLDVEALQRKMVNEGRGGYCFEQNLLFQHALQSFGFSVTGLSARVGSGQDPASMRARTHMLLLVDVDGTKFIADTGFGSMTLPGPIQLTPDVVQPTSHEPRRLLQDGDEFVMQAQVHGEWNTLYRFDLRPTYLADYEVANWYVSTHPNSHFVNSLTAARQTTYGRYTLRNNTFSSQRLHGLTERTVLTTPGDVRRVLEEHFALRLPEHPRISEMLQRVVGIQHESAK